MSGELKNGEQEVSLERTDAESNLSFPTSFDLFKETWRRFRQATGLFLKLASLPILFTFILAYIVYFLQKTNFQYSLWFTILKFFLPLFIIFVWHKAILSYI